MERSSKTLLLHLLVCALVITIFTFVNRYHFSVILPHVTLCLSLYSISLISWIGVKNLRNRHLAYAASTSVVTTLLLIIYTGSFISNAYWKANLNANLFIRFISSYWGAGNFISVISIFVAILALYLIIFLVYFKQYKIDDNVSRRSSWLILVISIIVYSGLRSDLPAEGLYAGEPIADFFSSHSSIISRPPLAGRSESALPDDNIQNARVTIDNDSPNIILIIIDALRADRLSIYGYPKKTDPFISGLSNSSDAARIENAYSICNESACGILSILMSKSLYAQTDISAHENLQSMLRNNGYKTNFILSADHSLAGLSEFYGSVDNYIDGSDFDGLTQTDDRGVLRALDNTPDFSSQPQFFYLHLMSSHSLGEKFDTHKSFIETQPSTSNITSLNQNKNSSASITHRNSSDYDLGVYQTDKVIQNIFEALGNKGYLNNSLIIITADHGEGLGENGYYGHVAGLHTEDLKIPLLFVNITKRKLALQENFFATQLDIAPTILHHIGIDVPASFEGTALQLARDKEQVTRHYIPDRSKDYAEIFYQPQTKSIYKYLFQDHRVGILPPKEFLFDVINDTFEEHNLLTNINSNYQEYLKAKGFTLEQ